MGEGDLDESMEDEPQSNSDPMGPDQTHDQEADTNHYQTLPRVQVSGIVYTHYLEQPNNVKLSAQGGKVVKQASIEGCSRFLIIKEASINL